MAADGLFPRAVARLHPRYQTPSLAIAIQSVWAIALVFSGTYGQLLDSVVFADWIFFGLSVACLFVFRRREPVSERPAGTFNASGYPLAPGLFVLVAAGVVASVVIGAPSRSAVGAAVLLAGVPVYYWFSRQPSAVSRQP
jgi:APA family basic amino acid/polyamine antiporter